jgi:hypothetical protein
MQSRAKSDERKNKQTNNKRWKTKQENNERCQESSQATMQTYVITKEKSFPKRKLYILK